MILHCRLCAGPLHRTFVDLGAQPLANSYLDAGRLDEPEAFFPLHVRVCESCLLVQLPVLQAPEEIFGDYAYFSSYSQSWLDHASRYVDSAMARYKLDASSLVIELASNDGYLLQYFLAKGVPALGVEPATNVADVARARGVPTLNSFFGVKTAESMCADGRYADLIVANNVLAHVPDVHDFVAGIALIMKPDGVLTVEVPHLLNLIEQRQFDTIYHEHFSYFSLRTLVALMERHGLEVVDVEDLPTHGGSLRLVICHRGAQTRSPNVDIVTARERTARLDNLETYERFGALVQETKRRLLTFLISARDNGSRVAGYGAPAKGNTLLNYCGVGTDLVDFTVDLSPHKQGTFLPGSRIPVFAPSELVRQQPDYVLILPWNLSDEIIEQQAHIRAWGGRFVVPIPTVRVID
jgi:SAM-dependent methyltransferase